MTKEITMTVDGGFYYRALAFHLVFTAVVLPFAIVVVIFSVLNPFWFRDWLFARVERGINQLARYRDKIKYRLYLGTDPEFWHKLKD